ncbi:MAG: DUF1015 family protein [Clostridiales bacterium]|nr:DUF1015 family protein [Clostridiales bacterium]
MAEVRPFRCIRPNKEAASTVAALPYDVYDREEARAEVEKNPGSFLAIDRAETQFEPGTDPYAPKVYEKAREMLCDWLEKGILLEDPDDCYYIYELTMDGRAQTGIVACTSVDDYLRGTVARHENTVEAKEQDRIRHVDVTNAQTGPIFLAYRSVRKLNDLVEEEKQSEPLYDFVADDGIRHRAWRVGDRESIETIHSCFAAIPKLYIADGHHRAASAVKVALKRRREHPGYTGEEPFNYFLSVLFPDDQLMIMPYNRVVKDLNGYQVREFLNLVKQRFQVVRYGRQVYVPTARHRIGMYLAGIWYELTVRPAYESIDPVRELDVSILQDILLEPVLGISNPRADARIQFVGGIRGAKELERLVDGGEILGSGSWGGHIYGRQPAVAFLMYPTSIRELFAVADAGLLMPPKSTWFEPKLRSGLFIHRLT